MKTVTPRHLAVLRQHFNLNQQEAADILGITRVTWIRWETGKSPMPPYIGLTLKGMVAYLNKSSETQGERE